jgi:hypothetical protein
MTHPTGLTTTTSKDPKFNLDSEARDDSRYSSLTGSDETSSRKDDGSKGKTNALHSNLLGRFRGKNTLKFPYGAHKGISPTETIEEGEYRIEANILIQAHMPLIPQKLWKI